MVFVTVGTQDKPFERLLRKIEEQIIKGNIKDQVIVQSGCTIYNSDKMEIIDLMDGNTFKKYLTNADLIITHGGVGTILEGLKLNKKIIAVPRLSVYREAVNDHQKQICNEFKEKGYILSDDVDNLEILLKKIDTFKPKKYVSNNKNFVKLIDSYIK